ncbi:hypothetical protein [Mycoplasma sp. Z1473D]
MHYEDIVKRIFNELDDNGYLYDVLENVATEKIKTFNNHKIPFSNLILKINAPIKRTLFISIYYGKDEWLSLDPKNQSIQRYYFNYKTKKKSFTNEYKNWKFWLEDSLSNFENGLFILVAPKIHYSDNDISRWIHLIRMLPYEEKAKKLTEILKY